MRETKYTTFQISRQILRRSNGAGTGQAAASKRIARDNRECLS